MYKNLPAGGEMYYGNLSKNKKPKISQKFMQNELSYLVCTSAFGMGVNKADVHLTSHIGMPYTLQEIYQMFGRTAIRCSLRESHLRMEIAWHLLLRISGNLNISVAQFHQNYSNVCIGVSQW